MSEIPTSGPVPAESARHAIGLLFGHWVSTLGSRLFFIAVAWFLTVEVGVVASSWALALFQFLPVVVMMPITLALVDVVGRRRIVMLSDVARAAICFVGAGIASSGHTAIGLLTAVLVVRLFDTLYAPSIRAGVTQAAGRFGSVSPQYLLLLITSSASLLAPLLVPAATTFSVSVVLIVNAVTYLVSLMGCGYGGRLLDAGSTQPVSVRKALTSWRVSIREGWEALRAVAVLRCVVPTLPCIDMAYAALVVVLPATAMSSVGGNSGWFYAVLVLIYGLCRIIGAEMGRRFIYRTHDGAPLALNCTAQGILYIVAGTSGSAWLFTASVAVIGMLSGATTLSVNEIVSDVVPNALRGRVFALIGFAVVAFIPFGPVVSGLTSGASPTLTLVVVGSLLVVVGLLPLLSGRVWTFVSSAQSPAS